MEIRTAQPSDRPSILALDPLAGREPGRVTTLDRALASRGCLVAESSGRVVGYGIFDHSFFSHGFIALVLVAAAHRRKGVGRALLDALAERCATPKVFTSTNASNAAMRSLLEGAGFHASGVIHNLDPGDPELVYFKDRRPPVS